MMIVKASKYNTSGTLLVRQYYNKELALSINGTMYTVNLPETPPPAGHVWIKDWSENEGAYDALISSGVITATDVFMPTGFVVAKLGKLTDAALTEIDEQLTPGVYLST